MLQQRINFSCGALFTTTTVTKRFLNVNAISSGGATEKHEHSSKNQLIPFRSKVETNRYSDETFKSTKDDALNHVGGNQFEGTVAPRLIHGSWHGATKAADRASIQRIPTTSVRGSPPSAFRFPAHFQPPRTLPFFSWPLNPLFLFGQRTISLSSTPTERDVRRNKCKPGTDPLVLSASAIVLYGHAYGKLPLEFPTLKTRVYHRDGDRPTARSSCRWKKIE